MSIHADAADTGQVEAPASAQDTNTAPAPAPAASTDAAASSPAGGASTSASSVPSSPAGDGPTDMLSAVRAAVKAPPSDDAIPPVTPDAGTAAQPDQPGADQPSAATDAAPGATTTDTTTDQDQDGPEVTEADLADVQNPGVLSRMKRLMRQRNTLRAEAEAARPDAENWRSYRALLEQSNVAPQDVQALYAAIAARGRGDHQAFLEHVRPFIETSQMAAGQLLPRDLQQQVDEGLVPEATARELARARIEAHTAQAHVQRVEEGRRAEMIRQASEASRQAVASWEARIRASDPDYPLMQDAVLRHAQALLAASGPARTPDAAVGIAQRAYDEVKAFMARARPAPQPTAPRPSSTQAATAAAPEPRSIAEAALLGLRRAQAR